MFLFTNGIATQSNSKLTQYLDAKGAISTAQDTLNKTLTDLTKQKADVQKTRCNSENSSGAINSRWIKLWHNLRTHRNFETVFI
jgi:flagellar capping protein FliD